MNGADGKSLPVCVTDRLPDLCGGMAVDSLDFFRAAIACCYMHEFGQTRMIATVHDTIKTTEK